MTETPKDKEESFNELVEYFELLYQILPMGNWRVKLEAATSHDMTHYVGDPDALGACIKVRTMQYADVYINTDHPRVDDHGETWEHTLIHEMLHVVTDDLHEFMIYKCPELEEDDLFSCKLEKLIDLMSYAIYNALDLKRCDCDCKEDKLVTLTDFTTV